MYLMYIISRWKHWNRRGSYCIKLFSNQICYLLSGILHQDELLLFCIIILVILFWKIGIVFIDRVLCSWSFWYYIANAGLRLFKRCCKRRQNWAVFRMRLENPWPYFSVGMAQSRSLTVQRLWTPRKGPIFAFFTNSGYMYVSMWIRY